LRNPERLYLQPEFGKGVLMPVQTDSLKDRLARSNEINITVTGRKSGRKTSRPVWFVLDGDDLYLLPVEGSDTQWYQNVVKNPTLEVEAGSAKKEFKALPITEPAEVTAVADRFRKKYGPSDVKKYYSKFDVAVLLPLK
jgi:deazaflavin-dependent oxidoreductase (nitroreductase family)